MAGPLGRYPNLRSGSKGSYHQAKSGCSAMRRASSSLSWAAIRARACALDSRCMSHQSMALDVSQKLVSGSANRSKGKSGLDAMSRRAAQPAGLPNRAFALVMAAFIALVLAGAYRGTSSTTGRETFILGFTKLVGRRCHADEVTLPCTTLLCPTQGFALTSHSPKLQSPQMPCSSRFKENRNAVLHSWRCHHSL